MENMFLELFATMDHQAPREASVALEGLLHAAGDFHALGSATGEKKEAPLASAETVGEGATLFTILRLSGWAAEMSSYATVTESVAHLALVPPQQEADDSDIPAPSAEAAVGTCPPATFLAGKILIAPVASATAPTLAPTPTPTSAPETEDSAAAEASMEEEAKSCPFRITFLLSFILPLLEVKNDDGRRRNRGPQTGRSAAARVPLSGRRSVHGA
mmetsp:Transcript_30563/g.69930  ORF Transcript_30563/g.69930 Transcript_30563/m.69930 type:complete len:216 (-) Transcript_30563:710-1357(-)